MHTMKHFSVYTDHPEGGLQDVAEIKLLSGFVLISEYDFEVLKSGAIPAPPPQPCKLRLTTHEQKALERAIETAWLSADGAEGSDKARRSVWAASRALSKIKDHLKGSK